MQLLFLHVFEVKKWEFSEIFIIGKWDWREVVNSFLPWIFHQGTSGSCWAAAAIAALEAELKITHGLNIQLSVQQVTDCSTDDPNVISNGSFTRVALEYMKEEGVATEAEYPFTPGVRNEFLAATLLAKGIQKTVRVSSYEAISVTTEEKLMETVRSHPVIVSLFIVGSHFEQYNGGFYRDVLPYQPKSKLWSRVIQLLGHDLDYFLKLYKERGVIEGEGEGVLEEKSEVDGDEDVLEEEKSEGDGEEDFLEEESSECDVEGSVHDIDLISKFFEEEEGEGEDLDGDEDYDYGDAVGMHSVLIVGYATSNDGETFWIVRNSYGPKWGEHGYTLIPRSLTPYFMFCYYINGVYVTANPHLMELE